MRLNLGGGSLKYEGYLNIDLSPEADLVHDLRTPLPYTDQSVEEILAIHVIESFYQWEFPAVIKDWYRVLKDGSRMTIEFTCLSETIAMYLSGDIHGKWGLFGDQKTEVDPIILHHYVYEKEELSNILKDTGFRDIVFTQEGIVHMPKRDWRVICCRW